MNSNEVRAAIARKGLHQTDIAKEMHMSIHSLRKKISGEVRFSDEEKIAITKILGLTYTQMNDWLFDGILPRRRID